MPESTVRPPSVMAWKCRSSPSISISMKRVALIESLGGQIGRPDVAFAQLRRAAGDEVVDALLRLDALVEMLVAGEARRRRRTSGTAARAARAAPCPSRACRQTNRAGDGRRRSSSPSRWPPAPSPASRAAPCPCSCCRARRSGRSPCGLERVVALAVHVERLVEPLVRIVVVAERRVELHAGVEQRLVRAVRTSSTKSSGRSPPYRLSPSISDELEGEAFSRGVEPLGDARPARCRPCRCRRSPRTSRTSRCSAATMSCAVGGRSRDGEAGE